MAAPAQVPLPNVPLIYSDGEPLESTWHRDAMVLLIEQVRYHRRDRQDWFAGGDMFIYFNVEQARNRDFRGPDFFFVRGCRWDPLRPYWVVWEEKGKYPNVVVELLSATTAVVDLTTKKDIYQDIFRTPEYVCYDPETRKLQGWRLVDDAYEPIQPNEKGWLWLAQLQLWIGTWEGSFQGVQATWLRFYDKNGKVVPTFDEAELQIAGQERKRADQEKLRADQEHERAEAEKQRAEQEKQRAEHEKQRAEHEKQRAEAALAELARLKKQEGA